MRSSKRLLLSLHCDDSILSVLPARLRHCQSFGESECREPTPRSKRSVLSSLGSTNRQIPANAAVGMFDVAQRRGTPPATAHVRLQRSFGPSAGSITADHAANTNGPAARPMVATWSLDRAK